MSVISLLFVSYFPTICLLFLAYLSDVDLCKKLAKKDVRQWAGCGLFHGSLFKWWIDYSRLSKRRVCGGVYTGQRGDRGC